MKGRFIGLNFPPLFELFIPSLVISRLKQSLILGWVGTSSPVPGDGALGLGTLCSHGPLSRVSDARGLQQQFASAVASAAALSSSGLQQQFASAVVSAAAVSR